jgi:hypothetical protein
VELDIVAKVERVRCTVIAQFPTGSDVGHYFQFLVEGYQAAEDFNDVTGRSSILGEGGI